MPNVNRAIGIVGANGALNEYANNRATGGGGPQTAIIALSATTASVDNATSTATITMTTNSDGVPTVSSSDNTIAIASISSGTITIEGQGKGTATITVDIPATSAYTSASATITVTSEVDPSLVPEVGTKYKLGSGAHTGGTAIAEATCLAVDSVNNTALMISNGLYGAAWTTALQSELDVSSYMGNLNTAIDDVYVPKFQGGADGPTTTLPSALSIYDGSSWNNNYNTDVLDVLKAIVSSQPQVGASESVVWIGTTYSATESWYCVSTGINSSCHSPFSYNCVIAPTFILDLSKVTLIGSAICIKGDSGVVIGETYFFGGFYWTAAEDLGNKAVCLQSQGMTAGYWPGYTLASDYSGAKSYGSADTIYNGDIDGDNIANYDAVTQAWYTKYASVEKTGQAYGSGLFLVSNAKCGTTTSGELGSGNYADGLAVAATNASKYGSNNMSSSLGTYSSGNAHWVVRYDKVVNVNEYTLEYYPFVIAPAFNLDLTKVKLAGTNNDHILLLNEEMPTLVSWANGTDAQITAMVEAADNGIIDLYEDGGWRVGDERSVSLSAIPASGTGYTVGESQDAQTVTMVLMDRSHYNLTSATACGKGSNSFVVGLKNCLATEGYMNSTDTNTGSWNSSARRGWCNNGFKNAIPSALRTIFKEFQVITAQTYNGSTNETTNDYFALPAAAEVFKGDSTYGQGGTAGQQTAYSNLTEFNALTRFAWYETTSNRIKNRGNSYNIACFWWERSPRYDNAARFCYLDSAGNAGANGASTVVGLSPFGCI